MYVHLLSLSMDMLTKLPFKILWWATRLTFNSSRILRHMTRLLCLSGDVPLAKRTLRLYIQVVGKSYEANYQDIGEDIDTDDNWVETLVFGARMLCRHASAILGVEGLEDVKEAGNVLEKARTRLDKDNVRLRASIEEAEGIVKSLLAIKGSSLFLPAVESFLIDDKCC